MNASLTELKARLSDVDKLRRLGQALWMMIERPIDPAGLVWARSLLGERGNEVLWSALVDGGVVVQPEFRVQAAKFAEMFSHLTNDPDLGLPKLVWTLPPELGLPNLEESYLSTAVALVNTSLKTLTLVSPFMEAKGVGRLLDCLLSALKRGVHVTVITHGATDLSSYASSALEELRREAQGLPGILDAYSARHDLPVLLHFKLVVTDNVRSIVGSANITGRGFGENLEAGVLLGEMQTSEITQVIVALRQSGLLVDAFTARQYGESIAP